MWNVPGPEIEPMSPALAGGFLTARPPGKGKVKVLVAQLCPILFFFFKIYIIVLVLPNIKMNPPQVYMCSPS